MQKVLVPVDGSPNSLYAVRYLIRESIKYSAMEIHLINVQRPLSRYVARFVSRTTLDNWYRDEAEKALSPCRKILEQHAVLYTLHIEKGAKAEVIVAAAKRLHCDMIVMSTARKSSLTRMVEASVTNRILELTTVPVEVIAGGAVSNLERYGIPTGIGIGVTALLMLALD